MTRKDKWKQYRQENEDYVAREAARPDVHVSPGGVVYRFTRRGHGSRLATPASIVMVHYTGRLIDGTVFDTTEGRPLPACFVVRDLIMGWQVALTRMREGDCMEVVIPSHLGYGKQGAGDIPPYSTLIFEVELVKLEVR